MALVKGGGPSSGVDNSREEWVSYQQRADDNQGNTSANYQGEGQYKAELESDLTKTGPQVRVFDPEISALLAGEL